MAPMEDPKTTDKMRHLPSLERLIGRVDEGFRQRVDLYYQSAFGSAHEDRDLEHQIETQLRSFIKSLGEMSAAAGKRAQGHEQDHLRVALEQVLNETVGSLRSIDSDMFARRQPFNRFPRSRWESIFSCFLAARCKLNDLLPLIAKLDPDVSMKLLELQSPREMPSLASAPNLTAWKAAPAQTMSTP